jgi:hypothetical protein
MGLARFELASRSPEPRRMDQATPQTRGPMGTEHSDRLFESAAAEPETFAPKTQGWLAVSPPLLGL